VDGPIHWVVIAIIMLSGVGAVAATIYSGSDKGEGRRRRRIEKSSTVSIADVTVGAIVKIVGHAEAVDPLLEAPLTGRPAIAFLARADLLVDSKYERAGPPVYSRYRQESRGHDFLVRDGSGVAIVRMAGARIVAKPSAVVEPERSTPWLRNRGGHSHFLGILRRQFRYDEALLAPGVEVAVLGRCSAGAAAVSDGPYREGGEPTVTIDAQIVTWS
jgi:hypothetical protein